ncbi:hypothetical protein HNY73_019055 [Argiope bruennichi]|uniref:Uncharacterized protein n=1 Tax=Argiope bruennichi TaxID=94029 RepID=A0A8T0EIF5_ARGBR|nr:hypothetical protein HNY73_019055 [Argiope bruennichi]
MENSVKTNGTHLTIDLPYGVDANFKTQRKFTCDLCAAFFNANNCCLRSKMSLKGRTIHSKERNIINNVTKFCEDEARGGKLLFPLSQTQKCAVSAIGVSLRTIK